MAPRLVVVGFVAWMILLLGPSGRAADLRVTLSTPRSDYLIGEPVPIVVVACNAGHEPIRARRVSAREIEAFCFYTAFEGAHYRQILRGIGDCNADEMTIEPGESRSYSLRLFSCRRPRAGVPGPIVGEDLVVVPIFDEAGKYSIKVSYPLVLKGAQAAEDVESNVVTIRVRPPERPQDVGAWRAISVDEEVLLFLQHGEFDRGKERVVPAVADVLLSYPGTRYGDLLRHALRRTYPWPAVTADQRAAVRRAAGVTERIEQFYPRDDRLDAAADLDAPAGTPLRRVLDDLETRSGVRLRASRTAAGVGLKSTGVRSDLRGIMQRLADEAGTSWSPHGGGYALIRAQDRRRDPDHPVLWDRDQTP